MMSNPISEEQTANLITDTCMKTSHVDLCISSLGVDPYSVTADMKGYCRDHPRRNVANAKEILAHRAESFINQKTWFIKVIHMNVSHELVEEILLTYIDAMVGWLALLIHKCF